MNQLIPFDYKDIRLTEACWIDGDPYFTRKAIGEYLGYAYPQEAVDRIIQRNPQIKEFSTTVKLGTEQDTGKPKSLQVNLTCKQTTQKGTFDTPTSENLTLSSSYIREIETRVYNPVGLQLILFESRQAKAREYKIAVALLVAAFMAGKLQPLSSSLARIASQKAWTRGNGVAIRTLTKTEKRFIAPEGSPPIAETTVRRRIKRLQNGEPLNKRLPGLTRPFVHKKHLEKLEEALTMRAGGTSVLEIERQTGVNRATLYRWFDKYLNKKARASYLRVKRKAGLKPGQVAGPLS